MDLGLPSGVKWATCNVGADEPSDYGDYFAWGETTTKEIYHNPNCKTFGKEMSDICGDPEYDTATANWGASWRMAKYEEFEELALYCDRKWVTIDGNSGCIFTGPNGNSIFMPAAGNTTLVLAKSGKSVLPSMRYVGVCGNYWTSKPDFWDDKAHYFFLYEFIGIEHRTVGCGTQWTGRAVGLSIRPVSD